MRFFIVYGEFNFFHEFFNDMSVPSIAILQMTELLQYNFPVALDIFTLDIRRIIYIFL